MRIKNLIKSGVVVLLILQIQGCDTREDWFKMEGEGATFIVDSGKRIDTVDCETSKVVDYYLYYSNLNGSTKYAFSDSLYLSVYGITEKSLSGTIIGIDSERESNSNVTLGTKYDENGNMFFQYAFSLANEEVFNSDTTSMEIANSLLRFTLKDLFDNVYSMHVRVHLLGDCPPVPVLEVKEIDGKPMEKTLSLSKSYDSDGVVVKYEYCIDGHTVGYKNYETRFEDLSGVWQGGKAAYGGTYITATSLSEVNHAFQTVGEHVIYFRCMDNKNVWSTWKKEIITISE